MAGRTAPFRHRHHSRRAGGVTVWQVLLATWLCWSVSASAQITLLAAGFDNKPLDQPIGTGGAALGEPASIGYRLNAIVRDDVMPGKSLAVGWDEPNMGTSSIRFRWLDEADIRTGIVSISLLITPSHAHQYGVVVRESARSTKSFGYLFFRSSGHAELSDAASGQYPVPLSGFAWTPGQSYLIEWVFDMDTGTSDLSINGIRYIENRAHQVDMQDEGLGSLLISIAGSSSVEQRLDVDDILVTWSGEGLFADGFEADTEASQTAAPRVQ